MPNITPSSSHNSVSIYKFVNYQKMLSLFLTDYKGKGKGKGVPLHAMEAHGGKGGIAPSHT
jgi:hypothetical protein